MPTNTKANSDKALKSFLYKAVGLYIAWYIIRAFVLSPYSNFDEIFIQQLVYSNSALLVHLSHLPVYLVDTQNIGFLDAIFAGTGGGIRVGEECDGIGIISTFLIFIIAFPGKNKILFALFGAFIVHLLNLLRIFALIHIQISYPSAMEFNHKYTFNILIYSFIFALWYLYIKYFRKNVQ